MPETSGTFAYKEDQLKTPEKWKSPPDARSVKGAGTYPNFFTHKTRSGHTFTMDDSEGAESVTMQHRSGSMVQFLPDGAVHIVSHNGQYNLVFGENRVQITGAHDVTVKGAASLRVEGDYNMTVQGNHNTTVNGDMNITAKNMNTVVRGNMDTSAKNSTLKVEGSTEMTTEGLTSISSHGGLSISSTGAPASILAKGDLGIGTTGEFFIHSDGKINMLSGDEVRLTSSGKFSMKAKGGPIAADGGSEIHLNSGLSVEAGEMQIEIPKPTNPNAGGPK